MIKEAQTIHLFRQEHDDDIADCVRYFNLEVSNAAALGALPQGDHLLKVGTHKEIRVHHRRTPRETGFTATDSAMLPPPTTHDRTTPGSRRSPPVSRPDQYPGRTGRQLGRTHQRPGLLTAGQLTALAAVAGTLGLLVLWHVTLVPHRRGSVSATSASPSAACSPRPRWTCPPATTPPARCPPSWCSARSAPPWSPGAGGGRSAPRTAAGRRRAAVGLADRKQARRSAGEIRARDKAAFTRKASVDAGLLDVDTAPLAEVGLLLGTTTHDREPVVLSLEDQVGIIAATGAGKTLYLMIGAALDAPGPLITTSTKPEILDADRGIPHRQGSGVGVRPPRRRRLARTDDLEPRRTAPNTPPPRSPGGRRSPPGSAPTPPTPATRSSGTPPGSSSPGCCTPPPCRRHDGRRRVLGAGAGTVHHRPGHPRRTSGRGTVLGQDPARRLRGRRRHPVLRADDPRAEGGTHPVPHRDAANAPPAGGAGLRPRRGSCNPATPWC